MANKNFKPGDFVRLKLAKREIDGTVLENSDSSVVLLKLPTGYNIAIKREKILADRILKKFNPVKKEFKIPHKKGLPKIGMVVTGGTIASKYDPRTGGVSPLTDIGEFASFYPEIFEIVNVKKIATPFMISSESMNFYHWKKIAEEVYEMLKDKEISGVIITHGTDTLHYTAAALSFFLKNLNKPVVLTYSQRSVDRASSDASLNLQCAARVATSDIAEVVIVGHASTNDDYCNVLRGTKVRKTHTTQRDTFKPINTQPIAKVWKDKIMFVSDYKKPSKNSLGVDLEFSDRVSLVKFYPGQDSSILDFVALKNKGVIIEATGLGHLPTEESGHNNWIPKIKKLVREGLVVCITSQCSYGRVNPYVYSNGRKLLETGAIFLEDMLPETALIKLGWVLGHRGWKTKVKEKMLFSFSGEIDTKSYLTD